MRSEITSTAPPSRLRLIGFAALTAGALSAGLGALLPWAIVGLRTDAARALDTLIFGIDTWEGVVVLAVAVASLVGLVALRLVGARMWRAGVAVAIAIGGAVVAALAVLDWLRLPDRFTDREELDRLAETIAPRLPGRSVETVRTLLEREAHRLIRVDVGPGLPLALLGGILLVAAGLLALAWTRAAVPGASSEAANGSGRLEPPPDGHAPSPLERA